MIVSQFIPRNTLRLFSLALVFLAAACTRDVKQQVTEDGSIHPGKTDENEKVTFKDKEISAIYDHYLHVKNALVASDSKEAQLGSSALKTALADAGNAKAAAHAQKIANTANLNDQRSQFIFLTAEIEEILRRSSLASGEIYKQYCPMANNGEGAYWLSSDSEIKNPYYGDEMLDCGEVKEIIK